MSADSFCVVLNPWPTTPVVHWNGWWDESTGPVGEGAHFFTACGRDVGNSVTVQLRQELTKNALKYGRLCKRCAEIGPWPEKDGKAS